MNLLEKAILVIVTIIAFAMSGILLWLAVTGVNGVPIWAVLAIIGFVVGLLGVNALRSS